MVEADSQLKLLPASILDIYKVFEHIDMLSMGILQQPQIVIPTLLGSDFIDLGQLWSQNDTIASTNSNLKLLPASILDINKVIEHIIMLSMGIWQ
jgi:hypothetical protein